MDQMKERKLETSESTKDCKVANYDLGKNLLETDTLVQPFVDCSKSVVGSAGNRPHKDIKLPKCHMDTGHVPEEDVEETRKGNEDNIDIELEDVSKLRLTKRQETGGEFIKDKVVPQDSKSSLCYYVPANLMNSWKDEKAVELLHMVKVSSDEVSSRLGEEECLSPPITFVKRKLLVLDVNGLLADIVMPAPNDRRGDARIFGREIFKRPFCNDFLKFCTENFDVAIWSSRSKKVIDKVVNYLLGNLKNQLVFCWDMDHSTKTGFRTLENIHKPLVCKELKKIWESNDPNSPWKKGDYDESNTLLLDDSPYKALLNPKHTAIFPNSYHYHDKDDNSLGPGGDLRVYLEGLLASENVQNYVEQHPYGQHAIDETSMSWEFYSRVLQAMANPVEHSS